MLGNLIFNNLLEKHFLTWSRIFEARQRLLLGKVDTLEIYVIDRVIKSRMSITIDRIFKIVLIA